MVNIQATGVYPVCRSNCFICSVVYL